MSSITVAIGLCSNNPGYNFSSIYFFFDFQLYRRSWLCNNPRNKEKNVLNRQHKDRVKYYDIYYYFAISVTNPLLMNWLVLKVFLRLWSSCIWSRGSEVSQVQRWPYLREKSEDPNNWVFEQNRFRNTCMWLASLLFSYLLAALYFF